LVEVVMAFGRRKILTLVVLMALYTAVMVWVLYAVQAWTMALLKDTVIWFVLSGLVLAFSSVTLGRDENLFTKVLSRNLKVTVVIEFLMNTYTFSLHGELILIFVTALFGLTEAVSRINVKYSQVTRLTRGLQAVIGIAVLAFAIAKAVTDFTALRTIDSVRSVLLAPVLSLLLVPFIYLLALYVAYELIFFRIGLGKELSPAIVRYAKRHLVSHLGLSLWKARAFHEAHALDLMRVQTKEDLDKLLKSESSGSA